MAILVFALLPLQEVNALSYLELLQYAKVLGVSDYAEQTLFQNANLHLRIQPIAFSQEEEKWNYKVLWNRDQGRAGSIYLNGQKLVEKAENEGEIETGFIIPPESLNRIIYYSKSNGKGVRVANRGFTSLSAPETTLPDNDEISSQPTSHEIPPPLAPTYNSGNNDFCQGPTTVITPEDFKPIVGGIVDAPLVNFSQNGQTFWLINGGLGEQKTTGPIEKPITTKIWPNGKSSSELFVNKTSKMPVIVNGTPYDTHAWIVNAYEANDGLLAFVHIEALKDANNWAGRVGLAWSNNNGNSFTYLGHIVQMDMTKTVEPGTNDASNVQGVPYLVKPENPNLPISASNPEYFYIYYMERGHGYSVGVARAKVEDVLNSARNGTTTEWKKYYNGQFESRGLGGPATPTNLNGVTHTDATFSTVTKKGYLILTMPSNLDGKNTTRVELHESADMVDWRLKSVIASDRTKVDTNNKILDKPGYQYATIVNPHGLEQGTIGEHMNLLVIHNYEKPDGPDAYRTFLWKININSSQNPVCPNYKFWDKSDFIFNNEVFYSNSYSYCKRAKAIPTEGITRLYSLPAHLNAGELCESNIPAQDFRYNGELYYSNSTGYCKYQNQNADSGKAEVYWTIPSGMQNHGSCNDGGRLPAQNFRFRSELYYSNGNGVYCKYQNQNADGGRAEVVSEIPSGMQNHGTCHGG